MHYTDASNLGAGANLKIPQRIDGSWIKIRTRMHNGGRVTKSLIKPLSNAPEQWKLGQPEPAKRTSWNWHLENAATCNYVREIRTEALSFFHWFCEQCDLTFETSLVESITDHALLLGCVLEWVVLPSKVNSQLFLDNRKYIAALNLRSLLILCKIWRKYEKMLILKIL